MVVIVLGEVLNLYPTLSFSSHLRSGSRNFMNNYELTVTPCIVSSLYLDWESFCEMGSTKRCNCFRVNVSSECYWRLMGSLGPPYWLVVRGGLLSRLLF